MSSVTDRALSAPGKLFVSGEYSVLWGGVARIAAVAPRVSAYVRARDDRRVDIVLDQGRLTGMATPLGVTWAAEVTPPFRFVANAIDFAYRVVAKEGPGFAVAFEASPTSSEGRKLGFGSSARATVLAVEAARSALGASFDSLKVALLAHADTQNGKGSGGDIAACFAGGLVRYRRYATEALRTASNREGLASALLVAPPVEVLRTPGMTQPMLYAFSGSSASTTGLITQIEREWNAAKRARFVETSDGLGDALEQALLRRDFSAVAQACQALQALLWTLGATKNDGLERLLALAATYGCAGKQSGAGGGDGVLVFAPDDSARDALLAALRARNVFAMQVDLAAGLQGDAAPPSDLALWLHAGW